MDDSDLVFLISQPRSGSTLLQRLLSGHSEICTASEPWILLPHLYARKEHGIDTEYQQHLAFAAINGFVENKVSEERYAAALGNMFLDLYSAARENSGKRIFLDKTPRYYLIIDEIDELFPAARSIILLRNPLAVLGSIYRTWVVQRDIPLAHYKLDLLLAPGVFRRVRSSGNSRHFFVSYEALVEQAAGQLSAICRFMSLGYEEHMLKQLSDDSTTEKWLHGDQGKVYTADMPERVSIDRWTTMLDDTQFWRYASEYLDFLGPELFLALGYSFDQCEREIESRRPTAFRLWRTRSLMSHF